MTKPKTFETAIKELEQIVLELENGDPPLEKALKRFEEGIELARFCGKKLDETEAKIQLLLHQPDGGVTPQPFEPEAIP